jgi:predicted NBD/HSP70 family sugar kinase
MLLRDLEVVPLASPAAALVFTTVLTEGPISRVGVSRRTGLSSAAVTKAVRPLLEAGYLMELAEDRSELAIGRPASPLQVCADRGFFVGIKVTGDELIGVVTDLQARIRVARHRALHSHDVDDVVNAIGLLVAELLDGSPPFRERARGLGLALAGDVDRSTGLVRYSPFLGWRQVPLVHRIEAVTGLTPLVENDVRALTVAERWFGGGVGASSFALVTVGAGIGCGLVVNDAVVSGAYGVAGEIGHLPVEAGGSPCHCGGRGCVESIASERAILERVAEATGRPAVTMAQAIELAHRDDPAVRAVFARAGHAIGLALAAVANLLGPERIIISGEGLAAYDLFEEQIRETFARQAFGAAASSDLIVRPLSFDEWARGAAAVAIQELIRAERG